MTIQNRRVVMRQHPQGEVGAGDFEMQSAALPGLSDGDILVRNLYLSLDPYMRLRMRPGRSYQPPMQVGDIMPAQTVGEVIESRAASVPKGALVVARAGWQDYAAVPAASVRVIDAALGPVSTALGVLGMPGVTAHYGLLHLGRPKPGQTVVVSAASGAVGSIVGQIAKLKGCRAVGIAGGEKKCRYVVEELGFDACVDYRSPDFQKQLEAATPDRVDVDFENVGGMVMDAVLSRLNDYARVVLCGVISDYEAPIQDGARNAATNGVTRVRELLVNRASLQAFIISEHPEHWAPAFADLAQWLKEGKIKYREDIAQGLENAPAAFMKMLKGGNFGKQLVKLQ
ncbi:MAG: NADP-dependent oxidoreductase [Alphaproteobacteria bacterium]|nr:NADP-dependent oxidoreductase [Alphaproteobacteria bacterium]